MEQILTRTVRNLCRERKINFRNEASCCAPSLSNHSTPFLAASALPIGVCNWLGCCISSADSGRIDTVCQNKWSLRKEEVEEKAENSGGLKGLCNCFLDWQATRVEAETHTHSYSACNKTVNLRRIFWQTYVVRQTDRRADAETSLASSSKATP